MFDFDEILKELEFGKYQLLCLFSIFVFSLHSQIQFVLVPFLQNVLAKHWKLSQNDLLYLSSCEYVGFFLGSIASGYAGKHFGRKKSSIYGSFLFTILLLILANVESYALFSILRVFCGFLHYFCFLNTYILFFEFLDANNRGKISNIFDFFVTMGGILLVVYMWIFLNDLSSGNWRAVIYMAALHSFLYFLTTFLLSDESVRYQLMNKNYEEAFRIINKIARYNKGIENYLDEIKKNELIEWTENFLLDWNTDNSHRNTCQMLFNKDLKKITPTLWIIFFSITFFSCQVPYTLPFTLIGLHETQKASNSVIPLMYPYFFEILSPIAAMYVVDKKKFGRVNSLSFCFIMLFLFLTLIYFNFVSFIIVVCFVRFISRISFAIKFVLICDIYPSIIRTVGLGICNSIGRIGAIGVPFFVIYLLKVDMFSPYLCSAGFALISGIIIHLIPETAGVSLDQIDNEEEIISHSNF